MKTVFKILVSLILLGLIVYKLGGIEEVGGLMIKMDPLFVGLILLVNTADRSLMTYKWARLLRNRGTHLPFLQGMKIYCASMVWGIFLPATMGADAIRAFATSRAGLDSNEVVASIVIERMVGFLSALLLGLFSLLLLSLIGSLDSRFDLIWWLGGAFLVGSISAIAASFSQRSFDFIHGRLLRRFWDSRIMRRLREFHKTYLAYRHNKLSLATFFALTFSEQLIPILHTWLIALGLGVEVSLLFVAGAVPLSLLISRLPVSIDGLGVYEGVFALLMSLAGVSVSQAIAIALVGRILQTVSWLPWWVAHIIGTREIPAPRTALDRVR